jgi:hypothetical protein
MTAPNQTRAVVFVVACILALPSVAVFLINGAIELCQTPGYLRWRVPWLFLPSLWFAAGFVADIGFGSSAWWSMHTRFRQLAVEPRAFRRRGSGSPL